MASGPQQPAMMQPGEGPDVPPGLSWDGDKMFHIYIYDYCNKRGYVKTARELTLEAEIPHDSQPPINAKQGLLFEWWSVFWTLFTAKNNGSGPEEALLYTQHQANQQLLRQQQNRTQPPQQPINRLINGMQRQPGSMPPNGQLPNGLGPAGMPNGVQGHMGFPMSNPSGHPPNGIPPGATGGPSQPPNMQQMMSGQRPPMGVGPQGQQQNPQGMMQMPPGQSGQMNRGMLPPNGPHMGAPMGSQQGNSPGFSQIGRPSSRPATPSQNMIQNPSPSMTNRIPPNGIPTAQIMQDLNAELMRIPAAFLNSIRQEAGLEGKEVLSFSADEKQRVVQIFRQRSRKTPAQPGSNVAGPSSTPSMQSANLRNSQARTGKRNSTSPGEEQDSMTRTEGSPPERKRIRPSPNGGEHSLPPVQPQLSQQPPPMTPMASFNQQPGPQPGPQGPMMRIAGPVGFPHQQPGMPMNPGMMQMSPGMMTNPPLSSQVQSYRQTMLNLHKNHIPPGALNTLIPGNIGSPQSNPQQPQGGGPQFGPGGLNPGQQNKPMGGMMPPPPSPGMNKAQQQNIGKEGSMNPDSGNRPSESSPQTHSLTQPGGQNQGGRQTPQHQSIQQQSVQQSSSGQQSGSGTAPQTPVSNPGTGMSNESVNSLLGNSQQQGSAFELFNSDLLRVVGEDFDPTKEFDPNGFLRADGGDLNFERDFGQWFNPDEMPLDLK